MNREDVIKMALEHGFMLSTAYGQKANKLTPISDTSTIEAFAQAVRAATKEECAKLIEPTAEHRLDASWGYIGGPEGVEVLDNAAAAIRASK